MPHPKKSPQSAQRTPRQLNAAKNLPLLQREQREMELELAANLVIATDDMTQGSRQAAQATALADRLKDSLRRNQDRINIAVNALDPIDKWNHDHPNRPMRR